MQVRALFIDKEDNLWIGTSDSGLVCLQARPIQNLNERQGLRFYMSRAIWNDGDGGLWVANEHDGLYRFEGGQFSRICGGAGGSLWLLLKTSRGDLIGGK